VNPRTAPARKQRCETDKTDEMYADRRSIEPLRPRRSVKPEDDRRVAAIDPNERCPHDLVKPSETG